MPLTEAEELEMLELEEQEAMAKPASAPKLTGNPQVDMAGPNADLEQKQKEAASPYATAFERTTGLLSAPGRVSQNVIDIAKGVNTALTNPSQVVSALSRPDKIFSDYIKRYSPENIKSTLANDPIGVMMDATVVGGIGGVGLRAAKKAIPITTPEQMVSKAESITQRILNPSKDVIAESLLRNSKIPAVRELAKVIKKSPTEKALLANTDDAIKTIFNERDAIIKSNNFRMTDNYINDLENFISQRKSQGHLSSAEIKQMNDVVAEEKAWLVKNRSNFDRTAGQNRKEYLQDVTKRLLETRANGEKVITQPARKQALDILRDGLKRGVEGNDPRIREINATYAGLKDAREMLANQAAIVEQNANKGIVDRLVLLTQSAVNPQAAAINIALKNANHINKLSGQAEKLMSKAMKNKISAVIEDAISLEKAPQGLSYLTPKYLRERESTLPGTLGTKRKIGSGQRGIDTSKPIEL